MKLPGCVIVTGTDTGVGKTVVTAALAATLATSASVSVFKPAQSGASPGEAGDIDEIGRLSGVDGLFEGCRLRDPLAPTAAARREAVALPSIEQHAKIVDALSESSEYVLVEGAGGVLVGLDAHGDGLLELAAHVNARIGFIVVVRAGLGTLNHARLTVEAIRARNQSVLGLVIGSDPSEPGLAEACNVTDLPEVTGTNIIGRVPEGSAGLSPAEFRRRASGWFSFGLVAV